jgi:hypothetical protein
VNLCCGLEEYPALGQRRETEPLKAKSPLGSSSRAGFVSESNPAATYSPTQLPAQYHRL